MFFIMFAVSLFPKIAGWIDIALRRGGTGLWRLATLRRARWWSRCSILMAPAVAFRVALFMAGLAFGKSVKWSGQERDAYRLTWGTAVRGLWPQTLFGLGLAALIAAGAPQALPGRR